MELVWDLTIDAGDATMVVQVVDRGAERSVP
jgi:hypothetical protein